MQQLILGDCIEEMNNLFLQNIKVDAIITDVPYGTTKCPWDVIIPFKEMWNCIFNLRKESSPILIFGNEPFSSLLRTSNIDEFKYDIYWEKERPTNICQLKKRVGKTVEVVSVFYKKQCVFNPQMVKYEGPLRTNKVKNGKLGFLVDSSSKKVKEYVDNGYRYPTQISKFKRDILTCNLHPTQKPLALMEYLVKTFTNEGDVVLDFCMGSGTTGLACKNLKRNFIGIEKDEKFFEIATQRLG